MAFSFAKAKSLVRRTVHKTFGVPAFYKDSSLSTPVAISARWHNKIERMGDLDNQGYAEIIQGIDRVLFDATEARTVGVKRLGEVSFPELAATPTSAIPTFILNTRETETGPDREIWLVSLKEVQ